MAQINGVNVPFVPVVKETKPFSNRIKSPGGFDELLRKELDRVKFSGHAVKRLEARNINISETEMSKLQDAVAKAEQKGAKDSLIMIDDTAFIVNIPNKTVVTAVSMQEENDKVFTNIDSVVFT